MFNSILIVCVGNICRSPMAEAMLRDQLAGKNIRVASAGVGAEEVRQKVRNKGKRKKG